MMGATCYLLGVCHVYAPLRAGGGGLPCACPATLRVCYTYGLPSARAGVRPCGTSTGAGGGSA